MRQLKAFVNKEFIELYRSGKFLLLFILFVLFGIMNPAIAKLTPWLMETAADSLADTGLIMTEVTVDAMTSWTQFYKNIPIALVIYLLLFSGIFTAEYEKGTLVPMITKGLKRWKVVVSKLLIMEIMWTAAYWLCFGVTYVYNAYFWDNCIAAHPVLAAGCFWLLGVWLISVLTLMSAGLKNSSGVMLASGGIFLIVYFAGLFGDVKKYMPLKLTESANLLIEAGKAADYGYAAVITVILVILNLVFAIVVFNKREITGG